MLETLSMSEYVEWLAYFSVDWEKWKPDQSPQAIEANLSLALSQVKKKKKKPNAT